MLAQQDDTSNVHTHVILKNISMRGKGRTWRKAQLKTLRDAWAYHQQLPLGMGRLHAEAVNTAG